MNYRLNISFDVRRSQNDGLAYSVDIEPTTDEIIPLTHIPPVENDRSCYTGVFASKAEAGAAACNYAGINRLWEIYCDGTGATRYALSKAKPRFDEDLYTVRMAAGIS